MDYVYESSYNNIRAQAFILGCQRTWSEQDGDVWYKHIFVFRSLQKKILHDLRNRYRHKHIEQDWLQSQQLAARQVVLSKFQEIHNSPRPPLLFFSVTCLACKAISHVAVLYVHLVKLWNFIIVTAFSTGARSLLYLTKQRVRSITARKLLPRKPYYAEVSRGIFRTRKTAVSLLRQFSTPESQLAR